MPSSFFAFQQGSDTRSIPPPDSESLRYGRFRAFSSKRSVSDLFSMFSSTQGSSHPSPIYGSINFATAAEAVENEDSDPDQRWWLNRMLISPRRETVLKVVKNWSTRLFVIVVMPAVISILWCAIPLPTSPPDNLDVYSRALYTRDAVVSAEAAPWPHFLDALENVFDISVLWDMIREWFRSLKASLPTLLPPDYPDRNNGTTPKSPGTGPGHGSSQVVISFWFFLSIYYGFYNFIGLLYITKIFNMYSLNWWPPRLGFPPTFTFFNFLPLSIGALLYYYLPAPVITQNLTWIFLTFATMCCPLLISTVLLLLRWVDQGSYGGLSETQLLFSAQSPSRARYLNPDSRSRFRWRRRNGCFQLPRSYKRFLWFCSALLLSLIGFVLGEVYAELYLRTLPHNSLETVVYVWSWVATIHILDISTGWILGAKVGSYPLGFVFKLYFSLTYQTYVRALYARLRSPSQFAYLQLLSSSIVIIWSPLTMTSLFHRSLRWLRLNNQNYADWKKNVGRGFYVRGIAENISMVAWIGWVVTLHFGQNTKVYPYFSFKDRKDPYTFELTFFASLATWCAEVVAGWVVRRIMQWGFGFDVTGEAVGDFGAFPELMPACIAVSLHVLQNMLFSIVRLKFY